MSLRNVVHPEIVEVLPWYVNDTLDDDERRRVELHLAGCEACRHEVAALREIARALQAERVEPVTDLLAKTRARLQPRGIGRWLHAVQQLVQPVPSYARVVLVAQLVALLMLAGALIVPRPLTTLSDRPLPPPAGPAVRVQVIFTDTTTIAEIRASLGAFDARIIDGPSAMSVFVIEIPLGERTAVNSADDAVARLRALPFTEFAEVVEERR